MATEPNKDTLTLAGPQRRPGPHAPLPTPGVAAADAGATQAPAAAPATYAEEEPRARAARRAAELREHLGAGLDDDGVNEFYIDPRIIPDGWSYEYKRFSVLGAQDPSYQVGLAMKGWEAVPASRHPELMPGDYRGTTIERKGMILMERPAEITEAAKARELRKARQEVRDKEVQLSGAPAGQFSRDNKGTPMVKVAKSYEMPIPEK